MRYLALALLLLSAVDALADSSFTCATGDVVSYANGFTCGPAQRKTATIATLPTCNSGSQGQMFIVTDALLPASLATVASGGAVKVGVMCNGTNWIVQ